jgi:hypothetical protein
VNGIEPLAWDLLDTATTTLTRAFDDDPMFAWVFPDPQHRVYSRNVLSNERNVALLRAVRVCGRRGDDAGPRRSQGVGHAARSRERQGGDSVSECRIARWWPSA